MRGKRTRPSDDVWNGHGGYMGMKKQKLVQQFQEQADGEEKEDGIFAGVSIFVNGWTTPSADELKRIMMTHGGTYHHYYNSQKTTHIIASNLPDVKMRQLKGNEIIVKPEWITACLEAERLVDYKTFLLFSDRSKANKITRFTRRSTGNSVEESPNRDIEKPNSTITTTSPFKAKDAKDPKFLGEFFQNSRLHHISTMGANAKEYVNTLRENHNGEYLGRADLTDLVNTKDQGQSTWDGTLASSSKNQGNRIVMHIDMDCFFVSVGLRSRSDLVGQPVAVCHAKGNKPSKGAEEDRKAGENRRLELQKYKERLGGGNIDEGEAKVSWKLGDDVDGLSSFSEVASCSYEARDKGVRNGMFLGPALKLCPDLKTIPYDFVGYEEVSKILYDTVASYTLDIQAVSCDEMFVDLTSLLNEFNMDPLLFVSLLRKQIKEKTKCACSVGLGSSILLARMATKKAKPDGQFLLQESQVLEFMAGLAVKELPGVGRSLERRLAALGIQTCGDMQAVSLAVLQKELGKKTGTQLHNFSMGIDDRKLEIQQIRKTVSAEVNYGIRFTSFSDAERFLQQLADEVKTRLDKIDAKGKSITLKLMIKAKDAPEETAKFLGHGVCDSISRSSQLKSYTNDKEKIFDESLAMLKQVGCNPADIRGIGISMSKLDLEEKQRCNTAGGSILKFMKPNTASKSKDNSINVSSINETSPMLEDMNITNNATVNLTVENQENKVQNQTENSAVDLEGLDPEVLASLPEDIRQEVLRDYKQHMSANNIERPTTRASASQRLDEFNTPNSILTTPIPSTSGVNRVSRKKSNSPKQINNKSPVDQSNPSTSKTKTKSSVSEVAPAFGDLDQSVLDQLPADLRQEIMQHYSNQEAAVAANTRNKTANPANNEIKNAPNAFDKLLNHKSPVKHVSPVKKRRGRPTKNSITTTAKKSSSKPTKSVKRCITPTAIETDDESSKDKEFEDEKVENNLVEEEKYVPTFCGKSDLEDIRPLIKGWLTSTTEPLDEDIQMMVNFLQEH